MTKAGTFPFMSVVVISYNGAATIGRALESLLAQDYPAGRFEVILVDDGSTDGTSTVVKKYSSVRYIKLPRNQGIPAARNAGLEAAKGDIYVSFDGDCLAKPDWLRQLSKGYDLPKPAGVGGTIINLGPVRGLAASYIEATGHGTTENAETSAQWLPSIVRRLWMYIRSHVAWKSPYASSKPYDEVSELYGANCSFPVDLLREVGGWDRRMAAPAIGGIEDRDLIFRIREQFTDRHFYAMHQARMMHDPFVSLTGYLLRPYRRGVFNYQFHRQNHLTPPLFPFPILLVVVMLATLLVWPWLVLAEIVLVPQLLYFWWPLRSVLQRQPHYIVFPYIQLTEETMVIAGLLRGILVHTKRNYAAR